MPEQVTQQIQAVFSAIESTGREAKTLSEFQHALPPKVNPLLRMVQGDALLISLSGAGGFILGGGGGFEVLYSSYFGWVCFVQAGIGLSSPGGSIALEFGVIWDIRSPDDYAGLFIEGAGSAGPGVQGSVSGSVTPGYLAGLIGLGRPRNKRQPRSVKGGPGFGTPGAAGSLLIEYYVQIDALQRFWVEFKKALER